MRPLPRLRSWLRAVLHRRRLEDEMAAEMRFHVEAYAADLARAGVPEVEARRRAHLEFGFRETRKAEIRQALGLRVVDEILRDVRLGARRLLRDWRFAAGAVLVLALGIGANTAIFSVINAALLRPSRFANPERLVEIYQNGPNGAPLLTSYPAFLDMESYSQLFSGLTASSLPGPVTYLEGGGGVRVAVAEYVTATYATVLGLGPSRGRWFGPGAGQPGAPLEVVLGHRMWASRFGGDPSVVGRTVRIEGVPATIVGVGPEGYTGTTNIGVVTDFWLPVAAMPVLGGPSRALERRGGTAFFVTARLRDGVTETQVQAAMDTLGGRLAREYPDEDPGRGITVRAAADVRVHPQADTLLIVLATLLLAVVGLVLAIACSNLATLLLVRGTARAREVSVRLALGASRGQIVRYLLAESVLLALAGGAAGCLVAWWGVRALGGLDLPVTMELRLDFRVLTAAAVISVLTGLVFGLAPALEATKVDVITTLREAGAVGTTGRRWFTLRNALVVFQVAVSMVLLASAGVYLRLTLDAERQPTGFAVDGVALIRTDTRFGGYSAAETTRIYDELRARVAAIPGVQAVALAGGDPMVTSGVSIVVDGTGAPTPVRMSVIAAGPGYFETLNIPILVGRALDDRDRTRATPVAVVNERAARELFGGLNAVGRRFRLDPGTEWIDVVGVAADTGTADRTGDLVDGPAYLVYRASVRETVPPVTLIARSSLDAEQLVAAMQRELRALDPALPIVSAQTMASHLDDSLVFSSAVTTVLAVLGGLGAGLAGIGLYAVVAFAVSRRSREIGIRMALGARRGQVVRGVAVEMAALAGAGVVAGLGLSILAVLGLRQLSVSTPGNIYLPEVDPLALTAVAAFMMVIGTLAACVPARRAVRMDPLTALRHD